MRPQAELRGGWTRSYLHEISEIKCKKGAGWWEGQEGKKVRLEAEPRKRGRRPRG